MGCFASTPKGSGGNRRKPTSIGDVSVYVPGLRIPKHVEFSQSLGDQLPNTLVERLTALNGRHIPKNPYSFSQKILCQTRLSFEKMSDEARRKSQPKLLKHHSLSTI